MLCFLFLFLYRDNLNKINKNIFILNKKLVNTKTYKIAFLNTRKLQHDIYSLEIKNPISKYSLMTDLKFNLNNNLIEYKYFIPKPYLCNYNNKTFISNDIEILKKIVNKEIKKKNKINLFMGLFVDISIIIMLINYYC